MNIHNSIGNRRKRPVNLTIRGDILDEARALDLNASAAAESGIEAAVKAARESQWLEANEKAIDAHNARVADQGALLVPSWAE